MLQQQPALRCIGARLQPVELHVFRLRLQPAFHQFQRDCRLIRPQQLIGMAVHQRPVIGISGQRRLITGERAGGIARRIGEPAGQCFNDGAGRLAQQRQFALRPRKIAQAHQTRHQAVAIGGLRQEFALGQAGFEKSQGFARRVGAGAQFRPDQLEFKTVRHLAVGHFFDAVLDVGDTFMGQRMRAQIRRRTRFIQPGGALQALEKRRHALRIKTCGIQQLHADAVRFTFMIAGEIDLVLDGARLAKGGRRRAQL